MFKKLYTQPVCFVNQDVHIFTINQPNERYIVASVFVLYILTVKFSCCSIAMWNWYIDIDIFFNKFIHLRVKLLIHNVGSTNYS